MNQKSNTTTEQILGAIREEGRATPSLIRSRIDREITRQRVNRVLKQLEANDRIRKVDRGLYEVVPDPSCTPLIQITLDELYEIESGGCVEVMDSRGQMLLLELQPEESGFAPAEIVDTNSLTAEFEAGDGDGM